MRRLILIIACIAVAGLTASSLLVNYMFGSAIGGPLVGAISVGFDLLKISMPTVAILACTAKGHSLALRTVAVVLAILFWLPFTFWGLQSAGGAALLLRAEHTDVRRGLAEKHQDLRAEKSRLLARNPWTPEVIQWKDKPSAAIAGQLEAYKINWAWKATAGCTQADGAQETKYCQTYAFMKEAQEIARQAEADSVRLTQVERELDRAPVVSQADPFSKAAGDLLHMDPQTVVSIWAMVLALLLEFAPNLGPAILMLAFMLLEGKEAKMPATVALPEQEAVPLEELTKAKPETPIEAPILNVVLLDNYRKNVQPSEPDPDAKLVLAAVRELGSGRRSLTEIQELTAKLGGPVPHYAQIGKILRRHGYKRCGRDTRQGVRAVIYDLGASKELTKAVMKAAI